MGILNDMGAVYVTTNTVSCDMTTEEDYDKYCYLYSHTYNNIIIDGEAFFAGANFIYRLVHQVVSLCCQIIQTDESGQIKKDIELHYLTLHQKMGRIFSHGCLIICQKYATRVFPLHPTYT